MSFRSTSTLRNIYTILLWYIMVTGYDITVFAHIRNIQCIVVLLLTNEWKNYSVCASVTLWKTWQIITKLRTSCINAMKYYSKVSYFSSHNVGMNILDKFEMLGSVCMELGIWHNDIILLAKARDHGRKYVVSKLIFFSKPWQIWKPYSLVTTVLLFTTPLSCTPIVY